MQSAITRLALAQFVVVIYCVLGIGIILKAIYGSPAPPRFATHLRDYGFLLLLLPAAWLIIASIAAHRPIPGTGYLPPILLSGLALLGFLLVLAFFGTVSATYRPTLVYVVPKEPPTTKKTVVIEE